MATNITLCCLAALVMAGTVLSANDNEPKWISLFNGKNLDGWVGDPKVWRVVDGHIEGKGPSTYKQYLSNTNYVFKNFILEAKFFPVKGNSGINYRSHEYKGKNRPYETSGYQCDIGPMGALYDIYTTSSSGRFGIAKKGHNKLVDYQGWNTFRIVADGKKLSHYINGTLVMEFEDNDPEGFRKEGFIAFEHHDKNVTVWFKDIRVRKLPAARDSSMRAKEPVETEKIPDNGLLNPDAVHMLRAAGVTTDRIVFAMRKVHDDGHWYANFGWNSRGQNYYKDYGTLSVIDLETAELTHLIEDKTGGVRDPQLHYSGSKILFSYRKGGQPFYHLYEIGVDGKNLRQLTSGEDNDFEPTYLPDGGIAFCSSRCDRYVNCWYTQVANIYRCDADGENIRVLSPNIEHDNTPWVLPDGKVIYQRWEYIDRSRVRFHHLWTMNPDGTDQMIYYGNMHPGMVMIDAKPIPGSRKTLAIFCPGHGKKEHEGIVTIVDPSNGPDDRSMAKPVSKKMYRDPYPFSETLFLVTLKKEMGLLDGNGDYTSLWKMPDKYRREELWLHEPRPIQGRKKENVIPPRVSLKEKTGTMMLENVYVGRNMEGVKKGDIRKLLILEALPKPVNFSGQMEPTSLGGTFTLNRVLGTVPVEADGSAHFELPALRSIFFVALDENDLSVKRMQSFTTVQPGERLSCVGCHEERVAAPATVRSGMALAMGRPASKITPIPGNLPDVYDFPRDIQPILDRRCLKCHDVKQHGTYTEDGETKPCGPLSGGISLAGDRGPIYSHAYANLTFLRQFTDGRDGNGNKAPRTIGTGDSPLLDKISGGHHGVQVTEQERDIVRLWIESSAVYAGTYAALGTGMVDGYLAGVKKGPIKIPGTCVVCHEDDQLRQRNPSRLGGGKPYGGPEVARFNQETLLNLSRPAFSRILLAPLSKDAGGYGICEEKSGDPVLTSREAPEYKSLLSQIESHKDQLDTRKRFDMQGFRPNEHYVREMKRYDILPASHAASDPIDVYDVDEKYWRSFWYEAH